mmetsp:Transcript_1841/g.3966  ORF Transcript_1841/g.3966 Transcript_1841/m.3966 type:complete len:279 (-) Transcript_1841:1327-2163(-)|eukprot:CAMPEP_0172317350 /NCGR_PEP_ID=MMETSP1058-20130122/31329_1 /TAXON_ID=83371 /ORGANISM="Detonula confervacea, Strain CCMP 353" /LENGTH=278 /DNA_ID=CAMNT_0013031881 /DNA_START=278 /DNA_END=1114 /DNA_ORIENTATION=-
MPDLPDISSMKPSELKKELTLYGIDSSTFCEKQEMTSALKNARENMPRPSTTYREVKPQQPTEEEIRAKKEKQRSSRSSGKTSSSSRRPATTSSSSSSSTPAPAPAHIPQAAAAPPKRDTKKILASRSPVTALQILRENPSLKILGERNNSFLPGSPFSFAIKGSIRDDDSAIIRIPDGVCLTINAASVERKPMETYLLQKGSIGVSLKISSEENPQLMPIWTFDKEKSKSYTVSDLGIRICGPRKIRLLAFMEMGFRSGASVDVFVFGSVGLDKDKF